MLRTYRVLLNQEQEDDLRRFARSRTLPARLVERSKMLLECAAGHTVEEIAERLDVARQTVSRWLRRYVERGLAGIEKDLPRSGRPPVILPQQIAGIVAKTTRETPVGATHWSTRTLAPAVGVSASTVRGGEKRRHFRRDMAVPMPPGRAGARARKFIGEGAGKEPIASFST